MPQGKVWTRLEKDTHMDVPLTPDKQTKGGQHGPECKLHG